MRRKKCQWPRDFDNEGRVSLVAIIFDWQMQSASPGKGNFSRPLKTTTKTTQFRTVKGTLRFLEASSRDGHQVKKKPKRERRTLASNLPRGHYPTDDSAKITFVMIVASNNSSSHPVSSSKLFNNNNFDLGDFQKERYAPRPTGSFSFPVRYCVTGRTIHHGGVRNNRSPLEDCPIRNRILFDWYSNDDSRPSIEWKIVSGLHCSGRRNYMVYIFRQLVPMDGPLSESGLTCFGKKKKSPLRYDLKVMNCNHVESIKSDFNWASGVMMIFYRCREVGVHWHPPCPPF